MKNEVDYQKLTKIAEELNLQPEDILQKHVENCGSYPLFIFLKGCLLEQGRHGR